MTIGRKNIWDVKPFGASIEFSLFQTMIRRQIFSFSFDNGHSNRLRIAADFNTEDIIDAAFGFFDSFTAFNNNGAGGFFAPDKFFSPTAGM
jgi:hypothetical protein